MEVDGGSDTKCLVCLYEALGTAILVAAVNLSGPNPAAVGVALFAIAMFLGPVSGGHVNPAVTIAVWIKKGCSQLPFALMIIASQLIGACLGCLIAFGVNHKQEEIWVPGVARLCPPDMMAHKESGITTCAPYNELAGFNMLLAEIIGTFIFISVIMSVKFYNGAMDVLNALTVGGTLFGVICLAGPVSGAAINPAVGLVQTVFMNLMNGDSVVAGKSFSMQSLYIYTVGPIIGGTLAGVWAKFNEVALSRQEESKAIAEGNTDQYNEINYGGQ